MGNKIFNGYVEEKDDIEVNKETGEITPENGTDNPSGYYPTCRFCGRQFLPLANYESQAAADEAATIRCDCFDARQYQDELEKKKKRDENIARLKVKLSDFGEYFAARQIDITDALYDYLLKTGINVLDGIIASASIKFARIKASFTVNGKGNIVIGFTYSDGAKIEV